MLKIDKKLKFCCRIKLLVNNKVKKNELDIIK